MVKREKRYVVLMMRDRKMFVLGWSTRVILISPTFQAYFSRKQCCDYDMMLWTKKTLP